MTDELHLDFETRSEISLEDRGLDNYVRHPSTKVLMMAWAFNDDKVNLWEPHKNPEMPREVREGLNDPWCVKVAWNAGFERSVLRHRLGFVIPYEEFRDPMITARFLSLPGALATVGPILGMKNDLLKDDEGERLIKLFCSPAIEAKDSGLFGVMPAVFRDWVTNGKDWDSFGRYCKQDVVSERAFDKEMTSICPLPDSEQRLWVLDQVWNENGLPVDQNLVQGAMQVTQQELAILRGKLKDITGLENSNSTAQFLAWIRGQGYPFGSLGKPFVARAFSGEGNLTSEGKKALELRSLTSKSAVHKFVAIANNMAEDGRLRNQFVFYGAARSGRWSGRDCQPQNFTKPTKEVEAKMDLAIASLTSGSRDEVAKHFSSPLDVVVSCARPSFKAPEGKQLVVCDLSAIEAKVLCWISSCSAMQKVFESGLDPYKDFATSLYNKKYEDVTKEERQNSKPAVLGCGYQLAGGEEIITEAGDKIKSGLWGYSHALSVPLTQEEAHKSVEIFREKFPEVVALWKSTQRAAINTVKTGKEHQAGLMTFRMRGKNLLQLVLPSGRPLNYMGPQVDKTVEQGEKGPYNKYTLSYQGMNQKTRQWSRTNTYGGRWVENSCQAIARDVLANGMILAHEMGFEIVGHVHDEIISLASIGGNLRLSDLEDCMKAVPPWGEGLLLGAEGYENSYYKKG